MRRRRLKQEIDDSSGSQYRGVAQASDPVPQVSPAACATLNNPTVEEFIHYVRAKW